MQTLHICQDTQDVFAQLIAWEVLNRDDLNPKTLLRQVPFSELCIVLRNVEEELGHVSESFMMVDMLKAEMLYRSGKLAGDWSYVRDGRKVALRYTPTEKTDPRRIERTLDSAPGVDA